MAGPLLNKDQVLERVEQLRSDNQPYLTDRQRIRAIMRGGQEGILALLGPKAQVPQNDLPVVHLMDSGLSRLAQKLRIRPDIKVDPRDDRDSDRERNRAALRERIVEAYDYNTRLELDLPQLARWVPGYGFGVWIITDQADSYGVRYPTAELRDPYTCWPGQFGVKQQPEHLACVRTVPTTKLSAQYPRFGQAYQSWKESGAGRRIHRESGPNWEGNASDVATLIEYFDRTGTYLVVPEADLLLDVVPNPLEGVPFVVPHRFGFDALQGAYHHVVGLMAMMAKLNILAVIAAEDAVFRETNVVGEIASGTYERGRFATNYFVPGSRIEKPPQDSNFQLFNQIDRLERQLRIGTNYSVIDDAESPNSFITGQGSDRLQSAGDANVAEYQLAFRHALEMVDAKRLEWDEKMDPNTTKPLTVNIRGKATTEKYTPRKDIAGNYRTRRVYGVMASWDEPLKIVSGLQLVQGEVIDIETMQENMHGLENLPKIRERIRKSKSEAGLFAMLQQQAAEQDPAARMALIEIFQTPQNMETILTKFFTAKEPELSPEEQMMMAGGGPGGPGPNLGPPPTVTTALSRLESGGSAEGGIQTVGTFPNRRP